MAPLWAGRHEETGKRDGKGTTSVVPHGRNPDRALAPEVGCAQPLGSDWILMPFCGQCGSLVGAGNFCDKCGARLAHAPATASAPPVQPAAQPPLPPAPVTPQPLTQPAAQGSSVLVKVLVGFLVFILLIVLAVMGSCVYIGYRAKKKADEIRQAYKSNDLNKLAGALGAGSSKTGGQGSGGSSGSSTSAPLSFPAWTSSFRLRIRR